MFLWLQKWAFFQKFLILIYALVQLLRSNWMVFGLIRDLLYHLVNIMNIVHLVSMEMHIVLSYNASCYDIGIKFTKRKIQLNTSIEYFMNLYYFCNNSFFCANEVWTSFMR